VNFITGVAMGFFYGILFSVVFFGVLGTVINFIDKKKYRHLDYRPTYLSDKKKNPNKRK
jgi:hypothetical protein